MISVIIPTSKSICNLAKIVDNQTYRNIEVIIIEDKSLKGAPWARNQGKHLANGKYLFFCDDDIVLEPTCLEKMINALENSGKSIAYCHYNRTGEFTHPQKSEKWDVRLLRNQNYISTMSLIRAKDCPEWDETLTRYQDWDLWLTMAEQGKEGVLIDEYLFTAHYEPGRISNNNIDEIIEKENIVRRKHGCELLATA